MVELLHDDRFSGCCFDRLDVRCDHARDRSGTLAIERGGNRNVQHADGPAFLRRVTRVRDPNAPWRSLVAAGTLTGLAGLFGIVYVLRVMYRTRRQNVYRPDFEDWICYTILPFVAYGAIFVSAIVLNAIPATALFALAAGVILLIFIGIRNAWDIVTYIATGRVGEQSDNREDEAG